MKIVLLFYCFLLLRDLVISFSTYFEMFFLVSRVYWKQPLCLGIRSAYILPFSDTTFGITLGMCCCSIASQAYLRTARKA
uniref:Uncharacterized protein n=1 Tax=Solanum tuberosum TaxID=4113 RepID=M1AUV3_SOLTU